MFSRKRRSERTRRPGRRERINRVVMHSFNEIGGADVIFLRWLGLHYFFRQPQSVDCVGNFAKCGDPSDRHKERIMRKKMACSITSRFVSNAIFFPLALPALTIPMHPSKADSLISTLRYRCFFEERIRPSKSERLWNSVLMFFSSYFG